ncbi:MAG: biotin/lipoyl-binding protein [Acidimicrobiales bacterium]
MPRRIDQLKKPWVVMPLVAMLALGGWWTLVRDDGTTATDGASTTDQVVEVTVGDMARTLTAEGTVEAADTEELSFTSAGTVTAVNVAAGDEVAAGDVLAEIDSAELGAAVAEAEAQVADAEAQLADDTDGGRATSRWPPTSRRSPRRTTSSRRRRTRSRGLNSWPASTARWPPWS